MEKWDSTEYLQRFEELLQELNQRIQNLEELQRMLLMNDLFNELDNGVNYAINIEHSRLSKKIEVVVQHDYKDYRIDDITKAVIEKFYEIKTDIVLETLKIYFKPEERMVYFVVNDQTDERYKFSLV